MLRGRENRNSQEEVECPIPEENHDNRRDISPFTENVDPFSCRTRDGIFELEYCRQEIENWKGFEPFNSISGWIESA